MHTLAALLTIALVGATPPSAVAEKERGDRLAANNDAAGAIEAYETALRLAPDYALAHNELGILLVGQDRKEEAVAHFREAVAADPAFALAHNNLGFVLRKLGRFGEAAEAYRAYVALDPNDAAGNYWLAETRRGAGEKAAAAEAYERYLQVDRDPKNQKRIEKAQAALAALRQELASATPAVAAGPASGAVQPAAVPAQVVAVTSVPAAAPQTGPGPAVASAAAAPVAPAAPVASTASAGAPGAVPVTAEKAAWARRKLEEGLQLRGEGKARESLFALQDAANAVPNDAQSVFELGVAYAMVGYFPQAIERWQRVLTMPIDDGTRAAAEQNIERARQKSAGGARPAAVATPAQAAVPANPVVAVARPSAPGASPALALTPDAQQAYVRGVQLYGQGQYEAALQQFDRAIAAKAEFPQAFAARGSAWFARRNYEQALADYAQARRLDDNLASPVFGLAEALNALGRKAEALPYYQAYIASQAADVQPQLQALARQRVTDIGR